MGDHEFESRCVGLVDEDLESGRGDPLHLANGAANLGRAILEVLEVSGEDELGLDQGKEENRGDHKGDLACKIPRHTVEEEKGQEGDNGGEDSEGDRDGDSLGALNGSLQGGVATLEAGIDTLSGHDGIVHHHSDHDDKTEQAHHVGGNTEELHHHDSTGKTDGYTDDHPEGELRSQEEAEHDHDEERALEERAPHGFEAGFQAESTVGMGAQDDPFRKTAAGVVDILVDLFGNLEGVFISDASHVDAYRRTAIELGDELLLVIGVGDGGGDFPESETRSVGGAHRDGGEFFEAVGLALGPDVEATGGAVNGPGGEVDGRLPDGVGHRIWSEAVGFQLLSVKLDGYAMFPGQEGAHAADAIQGKEIVADALGRGVEFILGKITGDYHPDD